MTIEINVPDIGAEEVEVTEILVNIGDSIEEEQSLMIVEGDKASIEIPATRAGVVKDICVNLGDKISTGSLIMLFEQEETVVDEQTPSVEETPTVSVSTEETPAVSTSADETSHKSAEEASHKLKEVPDIVSEDTSKQSQGQGVAPTSENLSASLGEFANNDAYVHASPVVRRIAREFGIDLTRIKGTGHKNRIQKEDVQQYVKEALTQLESATTSKGDGAALGLLPWPKVDFDKFGETQTQPLSKIKKISGANLARNWVLIPHVTQFDEVDITELDAFRQEQNALEAKKGSGIKLTPLVFIMKAIAKTLVAFPTFNSSLSLDGENLILKKYINVGVAVDTPNGLVVPVFKSVDSKGICELSTELSEISAKAREGKLTASDMQGGCFTISSLGGIGGTAFTPIVNAPEVAILGVSKSRMKPVWNGIEFVPRLQLPLSLSYDHRVIDGAEGARFITHLNQCLSDIRRLVL